MQRPRRPTSHFVAVVEAHPCVYWPEWGIKLFGLLHARRYADAQETIVKVAVPFYKLWVDIETEYTSGDGYLDKLCEGNEIDALFQRR